MLFPSTWQSGSFLSYSHTTSSKRDPTSQMPLPVSQATLSSECLLLSYILNARRAQQSSSGWKLSSQVVTREDKPQSQQCSRGICPFLWLAKGTRCFLWNMPQRVRVHLGPCLLLNRSPSWLPCRQAADCEPGEIICSTVLAGGSAVITRVPFLLQR